MFRQQIWLIPLAYILGIISIIMGIYLITNNYISWYFIFLWLIGHITFSLFVTVGLHRYFSHGSFTTNKLWHTVLAVGSNLTIHGSPLAWSTAHITHHEHSDTPRDTHNTSITYLIWKSYNNVPMSLWRLKHLSRDPVLKFTHRYSLLIIILFATLLYHISPLVLLFGYLMPLGSIHFIGAVHQVISHKNSTIRNMPYMEWILPASGEWYHKYHHDNPRSPSFGNKWYHLDFGYLLISLIKTNS
jgi:stearoyl-CoA desaturase (delta-9 desaturase)